MREEGGGGGWELILNKESNSVPWETPGDGVKWCVNFAVDRVIEMIGVFGYWNYRTQIDDYRVDND